MLELDPIIHEKTRLGIMSNLLMYEEVDFNFLKEKLNLTDGNLAQHLRKLESAEYIEVKKEFKGRKPHTKYRLTQKGKKAFLDYLRNLKEFLKILEKKED